MLTNLHQNLGAAMCVICSLVSVLHCPLHLIIEFMTVLEPPQSIRDGEKWQKQLM